MCFEGEGEELTKTENTQPALFLTDLAFANALKDAGIKADAVVRIFTWRDSGACFMQEFYRQRMHLNW